MLGVSTRKAGSHVVCPKCQASITVPTDEQASARGAIERGGLTPRPSRAESSGTADVPDFGQDGGRFEHPDIEETLSQLVVYDRGVEEIARAERSPNGVTRRRGDDREMLLIPRKVLYFQAGLLVTVAMLFFLAGWWIAGGRRGSAPPQNLGGVGGLAVLDVLLHFQDTDGELRPDEGAVVLVVPADKRVTDKLSAAPLDPKSPRPDAAHPITGKLNLLGAAYGRTDAAGKLAGLIVPQSGKHHVLLLSNHARRAGEPRPQDLAALGTYLDGAAELLGNRDYRLTTEEIAGPLSIAFDFGVKPRE